MRQRAVAPTKKAGCIRTNLGNGITLTRKSHVHTLSPLLLTMRKNIGIFYGIRFGMPDQ